MSLTPCSVYKSREFRSRTHIKKPAKLAGFWWDMPTTTHLRTRSRRMAKRSEKVPQWNLFETPECTGKPGSQKFRSGWVTHTRKAMGGLPAGAGDSRRHAKSMLSLIQSSNDPIPCHSSSPILIVESREHCLVYHIPERIIDAGFFLGSKIGRGPPS
jgi:hypothetical protein